MGALNVILCPRSALNKEGKYLFFSESSIRNLAHKPNLTPATCLIECSLYRTVCPPLSEIRRPYSIYSQGIFIALQLDEPQQGVVTAMCLVLPPATTIKVKSRDQAHRRATIKGSRWRSGHKYDQNQNKNARRYNTIIPCTHCFHCTLSRSTDIMVNY